MFIISYYKRRRWHSAQGSLADKMQAAGGVSVQQNSRGNKLARHTKICVACLMIVDASTQNIIRRPQIFVLLDVVFLCLPVAGSSWRTCICPKQLLVSTCGRVPVLLFLSSCMSLLCPCNIAFAAGYF